MNGRKVGRIKHRCTDCGTEWDVAVYNCPNCGGWNVIGTSVIAIPEIEVKVVKELSGWLKYVKPYLGKKDA